MRHIYAGVRLLHGFVVYVPKFVQRPDRRPSINPIKLPFVVVPTKRPV